MAGQSLRCICLALLLSTCAGVSPVQKVVELIDEMKAKVTSDLSSEEKQMEEYSSFCDSELADKGYAIKTATRKITDLMAAIQDGKAQILEKDSEIASLGTELASADKEIANVTGVRQEEHATFKSTEKELLDTVDTLSRAVAEIKKSMVFLQMKGQRPNAMKHWQIVTTALSKIVDAAWVTSGDKRKLHEFLQSTQASSADDDLTLSQPQAKEVAYESHSGSIVETVEDMKGKAEETLSDTRRTETKAQHSFKMMEQSLQNQHKIMMTKKSDATASKAAAAEALGMAQGELAEASKTKAADEAYSAELKSTCESTNAAWAERQKSASEEMAALDKAKEILTSGVKVFVQFSSKSKGFNENDDDDDHAEAKRAAIVAKLKAVARESHSFALMEMATSAGADPFGKIKGLIEDMIAKLITEANEEATQKAFCDEEMGKSKKSQEEKSATFDKLKTRLDSAEAAKAQLLEDIKELESEVAAIDKAQAEATKMRSDENAAYLKSSKDFKDSADATERAIVTLKEYYEGSLLQVSRATSAQPEFGGAKSDSAHSIISVLEMAAEDFTKTYTEIEASESQAVKAYEELTQDNKVSKAAKLAEAKAHESEVKSLTVAISHTSADSDMVSKELDAVMDYIEKLRPQCETKAMSYAEKKARREAEISGLKEALEILDGGALALVQRGVQPRPIHMHAL